MTSECELCVPQLSQTGQNYCFGKIRLQNLSSCRFVVEIQVVENATGSLWVSALNSKQRHTFSTLFHAVSIHHPTCTVAPRALRVFLPLM